MLKKLISYPLVKCALFSSLLLVSSCDSSSSSSSSSASEISGLGIDADFQTTVDRFEEEAAIRGITVNLNGLDIQYGDTDGAFGLCYTSTKNIVLNRFLQTASDDLLSEIILHELGHCVLGRDHSDDPTSIMHATIIIGQPWRTSVLDELFSL